MARWQRFQRDLTHQGVEVGPLELAPGGVVHVLVRVLRDILDPGSDIGGRQFTWNLLEVVHRRVEIHQARVLQGNRL